MLEKILSPLRQGISRLALVGLLAFGCGAEQDYTPCSNNNDCSQGRVCLQGECVEQPDCGNGQCEAYKQENCLTCPQDCGKCKELCDICSSDEECWNGQGDNRCLNNLTDMISYNGKGVCGQDCSSKSCPPGYACESFNFSGEEVRQCFSSQIVLEDISLPVCPTTKTYPVCENWEGKRLPCQGDTFEMCGRGETSGKTLSVDCAAFGLVCYYSTMSSGDQFTRCFGKSQLGEPCRNYYDCDPLLGDYYCEEQDVESNPAGADSVCLPLDCKDSYGCPEGFYCWYNQGGVDNNCKSILFPCFSDQDCNSLGENYYCNRNDGEEKHNFCTKSVPWKCDLDTGCPPQYNCDNGSCSMFSSCTGDQECKDYGYTKCVGSDPNHKKCV